MRPDAPVQATRAELRLPPGGPFREKVKDVPQRAEIVARPESCVGDADDAALCAPKYRDPRTPAVLSAVPHVGGERAALWPTIGKRHPRLAASFWCRLGGSGVATANAAGSATW